MKVMFLQVSVCPQGEGVSFQGGSPCHAPWQGDPPDKKTPQQGDPSKEPSWQGNPPGKETPLARSPPGKETPGKETPLEDRSPLGGGALGGDPPGRRPLWEEVPWRRPPAPEHAWRYGHRVGGTHPTGMQSCKTYYLRPAKYFNLNPPCS